MITTIKRLVVSLSLSGRMLRIATYSRDHEGLNVFRFRLDMLKELVCGERTHFVDLDGNHYCNAVSVLDHLSFRITFLRPDPDPDHLTGFTCFFDLPVSDLRNLLETGKQLCRVFEQYREIRPSWSQPCLSGIVSDPLKRRALSKALRTVSGSVRLSAACGGVVFFADVRNGEEIRFTSQESFVRGTDSNLYPLVRYVNTAK